MSKEGAVTDRPIQTTAGQLLVNHAELPIREFEAHWENIHLEDGVKPGLLGQAIVSLTYRQKIGQVNSALHGIIILIGPPGTGKTTIARGLANTVAESIPSKRVNYAELNPHQLTSELLGKTQKAVVRLLDENIPALASNGNPTIILLDEVETFAIARNKISMETNPIDIHRATDAILSGMDRLASKFPNLLFIATSNFESAVDDAFLSRADAVVFIGKPNVDALRSIFADVVTVLSKEESKLKKFLEPKFLAKLATKCAGLDGRQARKLFFRALASSPDMALHPEKLTEEILLKTAREIKAKGGA